MNIKAFIILLFFFLLIYIHSVNSTDNQQVICLTDKDCQSMYAPIIFCKGGLTKYFKTAFNNPEYAINVLAHDFGHFIQCMDYAQRHFGDRSHVRHVLRIFTHKLRAAPYVNAQAFLTMLDALQPIMANCQNSPKKSDNSYLKASINELLYDSFLNQFDQFKVSPGIFFDNISDTIITTVNDLKDEGDDISDFELKKALNKFLDVGLNKLIWRPSDEIQTLRCAQSIATQLMSLSKNNWLDSDDLYDLTDTLFERYLYFLDICCLELPISFFCEAKCEIEKPCLLFDIDELEECFEPRKERFAHALLEFEFKVRADKHGLCVS